MKHREQKRQEAEERAKAKRTPQEQLAHLDKLGLRAEKERAKLAKKIAKEAEGKK